MDDLDYFAPIRRLFAVQARLVMAAVGAILGCGLYFYFPLEPNFWVWGGVLGVCLVVGGIFARWRVLVFFLVAFFGWSQFWTFERVSDLGGEAFSAGRYWVTGRVVELTPTDKRLKIVLDDVVLFGSEARLNKVRFSVAKSRWPEELSVGHGVAAQVFLDSGRLPEFEGDYDGRLRSLVDGVSAYGFVMGDFDATYLAHDEVGFQRWIKEFGYGVERARQEIAMRVKQRADGVVAALLVGKRGFLGDEVWENFRLSGLAHLLAISGMHVGFMAGSLFLLVRFLIACVPGVALRVNGKWIGAVVGGFAAVGYMLLAGATLPTIRAALMLGLLFLAVLLGRQRLLLRALGLAVLLVLFLWPWSVVTASFQLSFVAALALGVWFYAYEERERARFRSVGAMRYIQLVFLSSLVAGLMTLPLTVMHFGMASLSGLVANMVAIPLTAFWLMPAAVGVFLTLPLGVSLPFEIFMGWGAEILVWWAGVSAAWPLAGLRLPEWSAGVLVFPVGMVLYYTFVERLRWACVWFGILVVALLGLPFLRAMPDVYVLDSGRVAMVEMKNGYGVVWPEKLTREQGRLVENFAERYRLEVMRLDMITGSAESGSVCDEGGCVVTVKGARILVASEYVFGEECGLVDAVILPPEIESCGEKRLAVGTSALVWARGEDILVREFVARRVRVWER